MSTNSLLRRYWFRFDGIEPYNPLQLGCGVTAHGYDDALIILGRTVFEDQIMPAIIDVIEDVDIRTLDQGHVVPNMEAPVWRGVWFPKGYRQTW
ncbi:hypothetical protein [Bradyrhizobium sp. NBAIM08]|uniref:hypothetical protein n=1 Tax=Bradyrhizobium sp. NBAIM08 TaxID=2793815 RepID=UPI001CD1C6EC|nr:hypothetical protein [Bradyrhizobium sp. NBAIM08]MCA1475015.1 hypothetical protein [Bradyrhizobium sp. NBAIM08]